MLRNYLKVFIALIVMWIISILTIMSQYSHTNKVIVHDENSYEEALKMFRNLHEKNPNASIDSAFEAWKSLQPNGIIMSLEEKLKAVKGVNFPPGMEGQPVILTNDMRHSLMMLVKQGWANHAFNAFVSDLIPVTRTLPDVRDPWCKQKSYSKPLPRVSVIICFHNEAWSTLIRTVNSVIKRTPYYLIGEVILFDDASTIDELKARLEDYIRHLDKVIIVRSTERKGIVNARIEAVKYAKSRVLVFLDSHCECTTGWLPPLLERILENPTRVVTPVIDHIHDNTFEYIPQPSDDLRIGGFNWNLLFTWKSLPRHVLENRNNSVAPIETPTISGGLFAISKAYFKYLGYYDPDFEIWGAENLELSFKTWMCGGSLEIVPCSHVGHVFRNNFPYVGLKGSFRRNAARLAAVWLDDYAKYFYERIGNPVIDLGSITERLELRKKLNCNNFSWYLSNVYIDVEIPDNYVASGKIYTIANYALCLDGSTHGVNMNENIKLMACHFQGGNQFWVYTRDGKIKRDEMCLDYLLNTVTLFFCRKSLSQIWIYNEKTQQIRSMHSRKCIRYVKKESWYKIILDDCQNTANQHWLMDNFKIERLDKEVKQYARKGDSR